MPRITAHHDSIQCRVTLPLSKSVINRLLVINYLSGGADFENFNAEADDIRLLQSLLRKIKTSAGNAASIHEIDAGNAGTVMRFLTAVLSVTPGKWMITGTERMQQRPLKPLTDTLKQMGADLTFVKSPGFPPVLINGSSRLACNTATVDAGISSQYISALMMIAPLLQGGLQLELQGEIASGAYIRMTKLLMQEAGIETTFQENTIQIPEGKYKRFDFNALAEPDWSAAAFWYEIAALSARAEIFLNGLKPESVQGDKILPGIFENLGVTSQFTNEGLLLTKSGKLTGDFSYDFTDCPDLAQAVIVTCAALGLKGRFTGLKTLRIKETDRIGALKIELSNLGFRVEVVKNDILLSGGKPVTNPGNKLINIKCYNDHRMAMSFAPLALIRNDISIDDPQVVNKSYPGFWKDIEKSGIIMH